MSQWFVLGNEEKIITALNLSHWSIEETLASLLFCAPSPFSFVGDDQMTADQLDLPSFQLPIVLPLPVFVWMREMESNERSFVNDFRASLFNRLCRSLRQ